MQYLQSIWADGRPSQEDIEVMNREIPAFDEEMTSRRVRVLGRELDFPQTALTVRMRGGEVLVMDGPFAETKEFIAGFDILECAGIDEVIEVTARNPIARFHPMELRPLVDELQLTEAMEAFGRGEDGDSKPFLLSTWGARDAPEPPDDRTVMDEVKTWRRALEARGVHILGSALGGAQTAKTLQVRDGETLVTEGSFSRTDQLVTDVEVLACIDRDEATELATTHPFVRHHAIEVRPFYVP